MQGGHAIAGKYVISLLYSLVCWLITRTVKVVRTAVQGACRWTRGHAEICTSAVLQLTTLLCIPRPEVETVATWILYLVAFSRLFRIMLSFFPSTVNREAGRCQVEVGA